LEETPVLLTHFLHLVRIAVLAIVVAGSIRCAPVRAFVPPSADAATSSALCEASAASPIGEVVERDSAIPVVDRPRVSIDVVRARVNSKRQVVAVDAATTTMDSRVAAVTRELAASGTPAIGTELRLVFATTEARPGSKNARRLVAVQIGSGEKARRAFHVVDEKGGIDGFYDASGRPLERRLLRYPVAHLLVTSRFATMRKHPITRKHKPHLGVDFAAPRGTPVVSVGDGEIVSAGWDGPFGRHVRIRHGDDIVTAYAHLDRIGTGIRVGTRVRRGEVIGTVGATGLATGPHLHFGVIRNGKYVDPLATTLPPAPALQPAALEVLRASVSDAELALTAGADDDGTVRVAQVAH
jgi:murein DD-endopeptidase MepM/ murein hydrolase activator NlpD